MPRNYELTLPATMFVGDNSAQLVAGDVTARRVNHSGRPALAFDDTVKEAAVSQEFEAPSAHTGTGTLKATLHVASASDVTNDIAFDVFVESKTPNTDTLDMESAASWGTANAGTLSLAGTTAGDPLALTITLTNADSMAAADLVRIGIRRNAGASGDIFVYAVTLFEEA